MLSLKYIRENKDYVQESLSKKQTKTDVDKLLELDSQRRHYLQEVEQLRAEKNKVSNTIAELKKAGRVADEEIAAMVTYERNAWGNNTNDIIQPAEVSKVRKGETQEPTMVKKARAGGLR